MHGFFLGRILGFPCEWEPKKTPYVRPMFDECRAGVVDARATLNKHWPNDSCLLRDWMWEIMIGVTLEYLSWPNAGDIRNAVSEEQLQIIL